MVSRLGLIELIVLGLGLIELIVLGLVIICIICGDDLGLFVLIVGRRAV